MLCAFSHHNNRAQNTTSHEAEEEWRVEKKIARKRMGRGIGFDRGESVVQGALLFFASSFFFFPVGVIYLVP